MKKLFTASFSFLAAALLLSSAAEADNYGDLIAQGPPPAPGVVGGPGGAAPLPPGIRREEWVLYEYSDRLLEYLTAELSLSDSQKTRIRQTAESFQQKMRSSMEAERNEIEDIFVPKGSGGPFSRRPENEMDRDGGPYSRKHPNNEGFTPTQQQKDKMDQISKTHRSERERYIRDFKLLISPALTNDQRSRLETLDLRSPRGRNGDAVSRPAPAPRR